MHKDEAFFSLIRAPEARAITGFSSETRRHAPGALFRLRCVAGQLIFIELVRVVPAQRGYFRPLAHEAVAYDRRGPAEVVQRGCRSWRAVLLASLEPQRQADGEQAERDEDSYPPRRRAARLGSWFPRASHRVRVGCFGGHLGNTRVGWQGLSRCFGGRLAICACRAEAQGVVRGQQWQGAECSLSQMPPDFPQIVSQLSASVAGFRRALRLPAPRLRGRARQST